MSGARRGTLILVVGPSGAGKDSIIAGAAARLRNDPRIVFARRVITRPAVAGGERHLAVSPTEFAALADAGLLMLRWHAHGFAYGLPTALAAELDTGHAVVANVSRAVVDDARERFAPVAVVAISVRPALLAARLAGRGRESAAEIETRLARADVFGAEGADIVIDNDGPLDVAVVRFVDFLRAVAQPASR